MFAPWDQTFAFMNAITKQTVYISEAFANTIHLCTYSIIANTAHIVCLTMRSELAKIQNIKLANHSNLKKLISHVEHFTETLLSENSSFKTFLRKSKQGSKKRQSFYSKRMVNSICSDYSLRSRLNGFIFY